MGWASLHPGKEFWQIRSVIRAVLRGPSREIAADDMRRIAGASFFFVDDRYNGNATNLPLRSRRNRDNNVSQSPKAIPDVGNAVIPKLAPLFANLFGDESGGSIGWCAASRRPSGTDDQQSYSARFCRAGPWVSLPA